MLPRNDFVLRRLGDLSDRMIRNPRHRAAIAMKPYCRNLFSCITLPGAALLLCACTAAQAQTPATQTLRIVGGLAGLNQYTRNEEPFWTKELLRLSGGKFSAEIVPFDRAGVPGPNMLRLIQMGVIPFGTTLVSQLPTPQAHLYAPDLPGLNPDMASLRKSVAAFRPYLEQHLREQGVETLAIYVYPAQMLFCRKPITRLSELAGRRIRVSSATQADFIGALRGVPVPTGFAEIMPNFASGNIECAVTGSMSGNTLGLHEVTSHLHTMPINWGVAVFAANVNAWAALPPDLKALLRSELPKLEAAIWAESERETADGVACNRGASSCSIGRKGQMTEVPLSSADDRQRQEIFRNTVLPRWIERCGKRCTEVWNQTLAKANNIMATAPQ